ncbi:retrovirus-related pol polyprotein from transposon TNT 1-94 [Tanacetum coccineum]
MHRIANVALVSVKDVRGVLEGYVCCGMDGDWFYPAFLRTLFRWFPKMKPLAEPVAKWIPKILDSGYSKHMMGNHALLTNFVEKFLGMVWFANDDFAVIAGYRDVGLEVAFRKSTCIVRTEDGVDLLTDDHLSNLYTISLNDIASNFSALLLAKASALQSWLWHQRLSHLNFTTINNLVKNNLVRGLPKMKFKKDHLYSACEQEKIHRKHHKSKTAFALNKPLYLLHMDLCGPMRVKSINGKRYVLVVVDDYSWYTWVFFLRSKDEASELIISFIKKCYLLNNYDDVGKLKAKKDIEMASKQLSLEPGLSNLNEMNKSSNSMLSKVSESSKKDLEDLFHDFYDEYFDSSKVTKSPTTNDESFNEEISPSEEEVFHEIS